ncbi:hypothetical protein [Kitasatospora paranensis]|uniref:hypothetical protein n=1 Tax=Kitasatospora paranensis TaxID=258053 RepID=UPI00360F0FEB
MDPLHDEGRPTAGAPDRLNDEAGLVHRRLLPVWNRETNGPRLLLLHTPRGDGLTLYDLAPGRLDADSDVEGFDDPRMNELLEVVNPGPGGPGPLCRGRPAWRWSGWGTGVLGWRCA